MAKLTAGVDDGTFGRLLGYQQSKEEAVGGRALAAITARDSNGTEVKAALADVSNPQVVAADPGDVPAELGIDRRSAKFTLVVFAKCNFIDPVAYDGNIVYVPQMIEYLDKWTRKRQPRDSVATPESLRSDSPQSKSQKSE